VAVFIDGCFWHGCPVHWRRPKRNAAWWSDKISANVHRDADTTAFLETRGWQVIRVWEHDDPLEAAVLIGEAVRARLGHPSRKPRMKRRQVMRPKHLHSSVR
jgi:DNA mismatch endonuclease (patch repair protein)